MKGGSLAGALPPLGAVDDACPPTPCAGSLGLHLPSGQGGVGRDCGNGDDDGEGNVYEARSATATPTATSTPTCVRRGLPKLPRLARISLSIGSMRVHPVIGALQEGAGHEVEGQAAERTGCDP
jgi:hypothetical protein